jgi:bifunctional DNA-binding transcriptional regulator/antitoxin component of YhaV-PrlF toxin-antitoxin module
MKVYKFISKVGARGMQACIPIIKRMTAIYSLKIGDPIEVAVSEEGIVIKKIKQGAKKNGKE